MRMIGQYFTVTAMIPAVRTIQEPLSSFRHNNSPVSSAAVSSEPGAVLDDEAMDRVESLA